MADMFKRKEVLQALYTKVLTVTQKVYTSSRPTATDQMDEFAVIRLPHGITAYADTHSTTIAQIICYARDRQGGVENADALEALTEGVCELFPFDDELISMNGKPIMLEAKSDGMGFHAIIIQFRITIKL